MAECSVADELALDALLDGMTDLDRASIERAMEHRFSSHEDMYTEEELDLEKESAHDRGYKKGMVDGRESALNEARALANANKPPKASDG